MPRASKKKLVPAPVYDPPVYRPTETACPVHPGEPLTATGLWAVGGGFQRVLRCKACDAAARAA